MGITEYLLYPLVYISTILFIPIQWVNYSSTPANEHLHCVGLNVHPTGNVSPFDGSDVPLAVERTDWFIASS